MIIDTRIYLILVFPAIEVGFSCPYGVPPRARPKGTQRLGRYPDKGMLNA
ncbi:hypothetical protein [Brasilonema bromeliae]|nr:hypothetical protein [Brasilonema bromeliae]